MLKPQSVKTNNSKKAILITVVIILFSIPVFIFIFAQGKSGNDPVFSVDGQIVTFREFKLFINSNRVNIIQTYKNKYNEDSRNFWNRTFDGKNPKESLLSIALKECKRAKIEQLVAKKNGVVKDISYPAFLQKLKSENERRKKALENNEVIYGPKIYDENFYYNYLLDGYRQQIKNKSSLIGNMQIYPSDEQLRSLYEMKKDSQYRKADDIKVYAIYVPYLEKGRSTGISKEKARAKIQEAMNKLKEGYSFKEIADKYNTDKRYSERIFNENTLKNDARYEKGLRENAEKLSAGQVGEIFEYQSMLKDSGYYIFKCIEKKSEGYKPFDEVKGDIRLSYINEKYKELIDDRFRKADFELMKGFYSITGKDIDQ